jgi:hypothetical protein
MTPIPKTVPGVFLRVAALLVAIGTYSNFNTLDYNGIAHFFRFCNFLCKIGMYAAEGYTSFKKGCRVFFSLFVPLY